ncbi:MAG: murein biosynthesis integral membrane protein MurJ [Acidimicrobiales bacterium]
MSRLVGFVRVLVVAAVLGTTFLGNAFQSANSVSNILFELLAAGALSAVLVPAFVNLLDAGDHDGAEEVAGGVLGVAIAVLGVVAVVGIAGAPLLARVLTVGVPDPGVAEQRELVTYLLRFFVPQVVLYAAGTIATAVLYAKRRFAVTAAAPMGNTVVMVASLAAFRAAAGPRPGFDLTSGERWLLVTAGTGGVVAFVGSLLLACRAAGFRLRPRWPGGDERVASVLRHSGWGVVLHTGAGLLLGGAIVAGSAVEGGVVAYQVAWVFFLAPYAILAQPIHTAILPELVTEARDDDLVRFRASVRWSLERMALLVVPVTAALLALALPSMRVVSFGAVSAEGPGLLAAGLAALGIGLLPYGSFLLLARAYYALGDSRTPGLVSLAVAVVGVACMVVGALTTHGAARVAMLGFGHSLAYLLGTVVLGRRLSQRVGGSLWPHALGRVAGLAGAVGAGGWVIGRQALDAGDGRLVQAAVVTGIALVGGGAVLAGYRLLGLQAGLTRRVASVEGDLPGVVL